MSAEQRGGKSPYRRVQHQPKTELAVFEKAGPPFTLMYKKYKRQAINNLNRFRSDACSWLELLLLLLFFLGGLPFMRLVQAYIYPQMHCPVVLKFLL